MVTTTPVAHSVPQSVRDWAADQLRVRTRSPARLDVQEAIKRLVDTMYENTIWQRMADLQRKHPQFDPLDVCMDAVTAAADWRRLHAGRPAGRTKATKQLINLLEKALELIPLVEIDTPLMVRHATLLGTDSLRIQVYHDQIEETGLDQYLPPVADMLCAMHFALQSQPVRETNQPFKMEAHNAARTSLIMRLQSNFTRQIGRVPFELVAEIANVVRNSSNISADHVRKI